MNLFARGLGGYGSDLANHKWGMPGRLWAQTICLAIEGGFVLIFVNTKSLAGAILVMVIFSTFVQAAEGTYLINCRNAQCLQHRLPNALNILPKRATRNFIWHCTLC
jgi:nitrate/nitrite transporter NarK